MPKADEKSNNPLHLVVCINQRFGYGQKSCVTSGSLKLIPQIKQLLKAGHLDISVVEQVCLGKCEQGPTMRIAPGGPFFFEVSESNLPDIVQQISAFIQLQNKIDLND